MEFSHIAFSLIERPLKEASMMDQHAAQVEVRASGMVQNQFHLRPSSYLTGRHDIIFRTQQL